MNINIREPPKTGDGFRSKDDQIGTGREPPIPESPQGFSAKGGYGFISMASPATGKSPRVLEWGTARDSPKLWGSIMIFNSLCYNVSWKKKLQATHGFLKSMKQIYDRACLLFHL